MNHVVSQRVRPGLYAVGTEHGQYHVEDVSTLARDYGDPDARVYPKWRLTDVTSHDEWMGDFPSKREALEFLTTYAPTTN